MCGAAALGAAIARPSATPWPNLSDGPGRAGLNTAITRTPLATTHILSILCGQSNVTVPCLAAALTALFLTQPFPFILSQRDRSDVHLKARARRRAPLWRRRPLAEAWRPRAGAAARCSPCKRACGVRTAGEEQARLLAVMLRAHAWAPDAPQLSAKHCAKG